MSHHIEAKDTMFSGSNITPWHGLGTVIEGRADAQQALQLAKLDWEVEPRPIFTADMEEITSHRAITRADTGDVFAIMGKGYTPVQNRTLAEIAETVVSTGEAAFETAGSLFNGKLVWFLLKIGERTLCNGEQHKNYLLASNGHAGNARVTMTLVNTRVVCWNTYSAAVSETGRSGFAITHTSKVMPRIEEALKMMKWAHDGTDALFRSYEMLLDKAMSLDAANKLLRTVIVPNESDHNIDAILEKFQNGAGNAGATAYDLFNGVTDWLDHYEVRDIKGAENRMKRVVFGNEADLKRHTLETLAAY